MLVRAADEGAAGELHEQGNAEGIGQPPLLPTAGRGPQGAAALLQLGQLPLQAPLQASVLAALQGREQLTAVLAQAIGLAAEGCDQAVGGGNRARSRCSRSPLEAKANLAAAPGDSHRGTPLENGTQPSPTSAPLASDSQKQDR